MPLRFHFTFHAGDVGELSAFFLGFLIAFNIRYVSFFDHARKIPCLYDTHSAT